MPDFTARATEAAPLRLGSLFSGYGGLDMAVEAALGAKTSWVSDVDPGACKVLAHHYPDVPNLGDITMVDWATVPPVDIIAGGSPCQDLSTAGRRAGMTDGTRSNLWVQMREAINVLRPRYVVWENVRGAYSAEAASDLGWTEGLLDRRSPDQVQKKEDRPLRALGRVLGDLADLGYDAQWVGLRASDVGAPHQRYRVFLLATDAEGERHGHAGQAGGRGLHETAVAGDPRGRATTADADVTGLEGRAAVRERAGECPAGPGSVAVRWGRYEPTIRRWERVTGSPVPAPVDEQGRLTARFSEWMMGIPKGWITDVPGITRPEAMRAAGNGVVPQQAYAALTYLMSLAEVDYCLPGGA